MASTAVVQLNKVHLRQLDRMLDAERRLRGIAESRAAEARKALYDIAERFCSAELDAILRERKAEVQKWTPGELGEFILQNLTPRIVRMDAGDRQGAHLDGEVAQRQIAELRDQVARLRADLLRVTDEKDAQIHRLSIQLQATGDALRATAARAPALKISTRSLKVSPMTEE